MREIGKAVPPPLPLKSAVTLHIVLIYPGSQKLSFWWFLAMVTYNGASAGLSQNVSIVFVRFGGFEKTGLVGEPLQ